MSEVWSGLSQHLIEEVLRKLPFRVLTELRVVCKEWNYFILHGCVPPNPRPKILLLSISADSRSVTFYDQGTKAWHQVSLFFIGRDLSFFSLVVSDGGLLCFQSEIDGGELLVCNLLSKEWKQLPKIISSSDSLPAPGSLVWDVAGLMVEKCGIAYEIIAVGRHPSEESSVGGTVVRIYHSSTALWTCGSQCTDSGGSVMTIPRGMAAHSSKSLFTLAFSRDSHGAENWFLLSYDVERNRWNCLAAPGGISQPDVFERGGQIYLVAQCREVILGPELCIWKLDEARRTWSGCKSIFRDLCVVFTSMLEQWGDHGKTRLGNNETSCVCVCVGHGSSIFVVGMDPSGTAAVWTHDLSTESWSCLPPVDPAKFVPQMACAYLPSLSTRV